jgi:hypothetical protein
MNDCSTCDGRKLHGPTRHIIGTGVDDEPRNNQLLQKHNANLARTQGFACRCRSNTLPRCRCRNGSPHGVYTPRPSRLQQTTCPRKYSQPALPKARRLTDSMRTGNYTARLVFVIPNPAAAIPALFDVAQFCRHSSCRTPLFARPHKSATPSSCASAQAKQPQCTSPA